MISRYLFAVGLFVIALGAFCVFVEFARHAITGRDSDDRLFGGIIAVVAFGVATALAAWGLGTIGL